MQHFKAICDIIFIFMCKYDKLLFPRMKGKKQILYESICNIISELYRMQCYFPSFSIDLLKKTLKTIDMKNSSKIVINIVKKKNKKIVHFWRLQNQRNQRIFSFFQCSYHKSRRWIYLNTSLSSTSRFVFIQAMWMKMNIRFWLRWTQVSKHIITCTVHFYSNRIFYIVCRCA